MKKYKPKQCIICKKEFVPFASVSKVCNECKKRRCLTCKKEFYLIRLSPNYSESKRGIYCSRECYLKARWKKEKCIICGKKLKDNQLRYCSEKCKREGIRLSDIMKKQKKEKFNKVSWVKYKDGEFFAGWIENPKRKGDVIRIGHIVKKEQDYWQMTPDEFVSLLMVSIDAFWDWFLGKKNKKCQKRNSKSG